MKQTKTKTSRVLLIIAAAVMVLGVGIAAFALGIRYGESSSNKIKVNIAKPQIYLNLNGSESASAMFDSAEFTDTVKIQIRKVVISTNSTEAISFSLSVKNFASDLDPNDYDHEDIYIKALWGDGADSAIAAFDGAGTIDEKNVAAKSFFDTAAAWKFEEDALFIDSASVDKTANFEALIAVGLGADVDLQLFSQEEFTFDIATGDPTHFRALAKADYSHIYKSGATVEGTYIWASGSGARYDFADPISFDLNDYNYSEQWNETDPVFSFGLDSFNPGGVSNENIGSTYNIDKLELLFEDVATNKVLKLVISIGEDKAIAGTFYLDIYYDGAFVDGELKTINLADNPNVAEPKRICELRLCNAEKDGAINGLTFIGSGGSKNVLPVNLPIEFGAQGVKASVILATVRNNGGGIIVSKAGVPFVPAP